MSNVVYLHGQPSPISRFLRVTEHRRLEQLLASDKLPYEHFVFEAGFMPSQSELFESLRQRGHTLILDTNVAESSSIAKFDGHAKHAPWANLEGILTEAQLRSGDDIVRKIARYAVSNGFSRVHAPTHYLTTSSDSWFGIDQENCMKLRRALDSEGGDDIAIDYPLLISNGVLNDISQRRELINALTAMPIDSLWGRISGFGADATAAGLRRYISAMQEFHVLHKPVVADGIGGLAGLAVVAFGAACGLSYGVAAKERFDASDWYKPPKPKTGGGGGGYSVLLPGIDRLLRKEDAEAIINSPSGRRLASCSDRSCCPQGFEDTIKDPKGHFLRQRAIRCDALSAVPEPVRAQHFVDKDLTEADRRARSLAKLRISDDKIVSRLRENADRLDRLRDVLGSLEKTSASATRSAAFTAAVHGRQSRKDRR